MQKHPNEFTRALIRKYFADRHREAEVAAIAQGYVIFFPRFSVIDACTVADPSGRLLYDPSRELWKLYWMSGRFRWHLYDRYPRLQQALEVISGEQAPSLFNKVL